MNQLNNSEHKIKDLKYGLIVLDPNQEGKFKNILHFVGYWEEPTKEDAAHLHEELNTDVE
jgi:hypothetical protein